MSNITPLNDKVKIPSHGDGDGGDGMDQILRRIDRLENNVDKLKDGINDLKVGLTELKTEFKANQPHIVTKSWLATAVILIVLAQIFVPNVRYYLSLDHQTSQKQLAYSSNSAHKPLQD